MNYTLKVSFIIIYYNFTRDFTQKLNSVLHRVFDQRIYRAVVKMPPYLTPKANVMETSNLACILLFIKVFF